MAGIRGIVRYVQWRMRNEEWECVLSVKGASLYIRSMIIGERRFFFSFVLYSLFWLVVIFFASICPSSCGFSFCIDSMVLHYYYMFCNCIGDTVIKYVYYFILTIVVSLLFPSLNPVQLFCCFFCTFRFYLTLDQLDFLLSQ